MRNLLAKTLSRKEGMGGLMCVKSMGPYIEQLEKVRATERLYSRVLKAILNCLAELVEQRAMTHAHIWWQPFLS